jgi:glycerol dehydrogenase
MDPKIMVFPHRYVQGPGVLSSISEHLSVLGIDRPLVLIDPAVINVCREIIEIDLKANAIQCRFLPFNGDSTWSEVARAKEACIDGDHDAIISCGGGKTLDTGRAAAAGNAMNCGVVPPEPMEDLGAGVACIQVPTIASTDASTSRACLIYNEQGAYETVLFVPTNPAMVLVDTLIISKAPVRTFVAGMGDALATYFEADTCRRTKARTPAGGLQTRSALTLARLAFDLLMTHGLEAKKENEAGVPGPALEAVVEANTLLSGLGFENGGLSAAHAIADCLPQLKEHFHVPPLHGEMVSYGTVVHLLLEGKDKESLKQVIAFCKSVGLPTTLKDMGLTEFSDQELWDLANAVSKDPIIRSMPHAGQATDDDGRFYDSGHIFRAMKTAESS